MGGKDSVEKNLKRLQQMARTGTSQERERLVTEGVPDDIAEKYELPEGEALMLAPAELAAMRELETALRSDPRFEHLSRQEQAREAVIRLVSLSTLDRRTDHVPAFLAEYAREPEERACYIPIELLKVSRRHDLFGIKLLPPDDESIPSMEPWSKLEPPIGAVAVVSVSGTHLGLMAARARAITGRALRVLRVALVQQGWLAPRQLRFRAGAVYSFGEGLTGWETSHDARWSLDFDDELERFALERPVSRLAPNGSDEIQKRGRLALQWIEHALFEADMVNAMLFLFFALESILGDKAEGLKAPGLAFRRAMLSSVVHGRFADPGRAYFLYEAVRSTAVHGETPPAVNEKDAIRLLWDVCRALDEYLTLAERENLRRRADVRRFLRDHPDAPKLASWLREHGGGEWARFLDEEFPGGSAVGG